MVALSSLRAKVGSSCASNWPFFTVSPSLTRIVRTIAVSSGCTMTLGDCARITAGALTSRSTGTTPNTTKVATTRLDSSHVVMRAENDAGRAISVSVGDWNSSTAWLAT